ncbi:TIGR03936 family radical SAM-associated protein [Goodfellowiella coeruleoviolacea]|uniref:Radical SAM-linked protein n=1 Tax=Goodfellowiella coeruleoviolacea TaxID=334858 RepID=A0AAE3GBK2_9PSEU|nr:TIGR03936 family radical SAM-associated protein [Goodfellowiella coeruleoviolacea]MCP2165115.1 radical SAM-linked protein [Goodfellowiella coeruleoviolacea]
MQKLRIRYAKRGRLRFTSHRDVARTFERALRRAGVPMAYSQGFNPHPKVSWIGASPTGVASEAEYVEIQVVEPVDPRALRTALDAALPPGLDVLETVEAGPGALADRIEASRWRIELPGVTPDELRTAVAALLAAESVQVERLTKDGRREIDVRPAVVSAEVVADSTAAGGTDTAAPTAVSGAGQDAGSAADHGAPPEVGHVQPDDSAGLPRSCGILVTVVRQTTPAVRPDDVLSALRVVADLVPPVPAKATRMAQGRLDDDGRLVDPFARERAAASAPAVGEQEPGEDVVGGPVA